MSDPSELAAAIRRDGYVVARDLIPPHTVREIKEALAPWLSGRHFGRNDFEGFRSERVYALLAKAPAIAKIVEHPTVLGVCDQLLQRHYRLSACLAIQVHPGETAQGWHSDDGYVALPRPRPMVGVSTIWAFDDFTDDNGATEVIPGSHLWGSEEPPASDDDARAVRIRMSAGSAVLFAGTLVHRGGAHRDTTTRLGITPQYCEPWVRQIENMVLAVPPDCARGYSERVQELLGYDVLEPFIGYVDGVHPKRLLGPEYAARMKRAQ